MKVKYWLDTIERNTSERFPHLVCGWPDEEHGITHNAYVEAAMVELEDLEDGEDVQPWPSFEQWKAERRSVDEYRDELGFSHMKCELCGSFPGDRYAVTAMPTNPAENHDYVALSVCGDCLQWVANDEVPDWLEGEND